ncbi:hypothetical protein [Bradyrhizobium canariense]|uniref:hypothetical protein n=1 Tax=Bradyrhizobium canariense TaxID=255045 RepID=UPI0011775F28|nr:hypothetical protein [Bradyrhizobium canariense]
MSANQKLRVIGACPSAGQQVLAPALLVAPLESFHTLPIQQLLLLLLLLDGEADEAVADDHLAEHRHADHPRAAVARPRMPVMMI